MLFNSTRRTLLSISASGATLAACLIGIVPATAQTVQAQAQPSGVATDPPSPASVGAPPSAAPQTAETGDIIVTANKRQETLMSVPASVTAVSGDQLVKKGINDVQDLVKVTPGLSYVESGRGVPVFSLRGVGFFDQSFASRPTVSVYVDEAPVPFSIEAKGASFDLERVEVLKGPQGTLFGQNATGGAINYIAAKPTDEFHAGGTASFGRFNTGDVQGYVSGPLGSTLTARLAVRTVQSGDWQRSYTRNDGLGATNFTQGRAILEYKPTDRLTVSLSGSVFVDRSDTPAAQAEVYIPTLAARTPFIPLVANLTPAPANDRAADWDPGKDYRVDNKFYQAALRIDYQALDFFKITSITSFVRENLRQLADGDGTPYTNNESQNSGYLSSFSQEVRGSGDIGALGYIVGVNFAHDRTLTNTVTNFPYSTAAFSVAPPPTPGFSLLGSRLNQQFDTYAAFGNLDYHVTSTITLHGGVRYTIADLHYQACSYPGAPDSASTFTAIDNRTLASLGRPLIGPLQVGQCSALLTSGSPGLFSDKLDQSNVSWRGGVDFKPSSSTLLYASVSKGYKAGSSSTPSATNSLQYSPAGQESVLAYEVGAKLSLLQHKVEVTGAAFYYDYTDKQVQGRKVFTPNVFGPINTLTNIPKSRIEGGEAQVTLYPVRALRLTAAGTYLDTKVTSDFVNSDLLGISTNFNGNAFPYTPKWQVVLDGEYRIPVGERLAFVVGSNANYRSSTVAGFGGSSLLDIKAYWLVDARAGVDLAGGKYRVQLYGRNIGNTYYWTNVAKNNDIVRRYAGMPVTYGLQISARY